MSTLFLQILFAYTCECTNIFPMLNIYIYDHTLTLKYLQKNFKNKKKELGTKEFEDCHSMQKICRRAILKKVIFTTISK